MTTQTLTVTDPGQSTLQVDEPAALQLLEVGVPGPPGPDVKADRDTAVQAAADSQAAAAAAAASAGGAAADRAQADLDVQLTAADRIQTDQDVIAANAARDAAQGFQLTATAQAALAAAGAAAASSVAQQDLSGVTATALHRSPNAITAAFVYDTSKDSDGGAWRDRVDATSWMNEALNGNWMVPYATQGIQSELDARTTNASFGPDLLNGAGAFTSSAGWTFTGGTIANGTATKSDTAVDLTTPITVTTGKLYEITWEIAFRAGSTSTNTGVGVHQSSGVFQRTVTGTARYTALGKYREVLVASGTGNLVINFAIGAGQTISIANLKVREIIALTDKTGDFYQLATDGKFYKLNRNQHGLSASPVAASYGYTVSGAGDAVTANYGIGVGGANTTSRVQTGSVARVVRSVSANCGIDSTNLSYCISFHYRGTLSQIFGVGARAGASIAPTDLGVVSGTLRRAYAVVTSGANGTAFIDFTINANSDIEIGDIMVEQGVTSPSAYELRSNANSLAGGSEETFRGNTAKFPRLAGLVAEAANLTIYALDQPGRPMWMRFVWNSSFNNMVCQAGNIKTVAALNGIMSVGDGTFDACFISFLRDGAWRSLGDDFRGNIAQRNTTISWTGLVTRPQIVNRQVNAIAMTVLPNAPVDPVTGLQVPTIGIAVGTGNAGNLGSVIMNDGTIVNYAQGSNDGTSVAFTPRGEVMWGISTSSSLPVVPLQTSNVANVLTLAGNRAYGGAAIPSGGSGASKRAVMAGGVIAARPSVTADLNKLILIKENPSTATSGMVAHVTGVYNTGLMAGDVRRALASDVDVGSISSVANEAVPVAGATWTDNGGGSYTSNTTNYGSYLTLGGTAGYAYVVTFTISGGVVVQVTAGTWTSASYTTPGAYRVSVPPGASAPRIQAQVGATVSAISMQKAVADRSVKDRSASVNGTLTKTAVAAAAQLVAYSSFTNDPLVELITNGTFTIDTSSWAPVSGGTLSVVAGRLRITNDGTGTNFGKASQGFPTVVGRSYTLRVERSGTGTNAGGYHVGIAPGSASIFNAATAAQVTFTATATTTYVSPGVTTGAAGATADFDNISCTAADAIGSAANVAQEPYSADADAGTAAWAARAWASVPVTGFGPLNRVLYSQDATNVAWAKEGNNTYTLVPAGGDGPNGLPYTRVTFGATFTAPFALAQNMSVVSGEVYTASMWIRLVSGTKPSINVVFNDGASSVVPTAVWQRVQCVIPATSTGTVGFRIDRSQSAGVVYDVTGIQLERGSVAGPYAATTSAAFVGIAPIIDRSGPSGAYYRVGIDGNGFWAAEAFDGTTTRRVTSTITGNTGVFQSVEANYQTTGTLALRVNGSLISQATGAALLTLNNASALLTYGNSYALNAAFPGQFSLAQVGATVMSADAAAWTYAQERQMFRDGAQVTLPDTGNIVDLGYDDALDRVLVATATNECALNGLVRVASAPAAAGSVTKITGRSGVKLIARSTTNPGMDVTLPAQNLKEELLRRAEDAARLARQAPRAFDFDATASQTDFTLPAGWEAIEVIAARSSQREGATKDWVRKFDGFRETFSFAVGQSVNTWVQAIARRFQ